MVTTAKPLPLCSSVVARGEGEFSGEFEFEFELEILLRIQMSRHPIIAILTVQLRGKFGQNSNLEQLRIRIHAACRFIIICIIRRSGSGQPTAGEQLKAERSERRVRSFGE